MAKKTLAAKLTTEDGSTILVYKSGRSYWLNYQGEQKLCHPSVRSLEDTSREASIIFHVNIVDFEPY